VNYKHCNLYTDQRSRLWVQLTKSLISFSCTDHAFSSFDSKTLHQRSTVHELMSRNFLMMTCRVSKPQNSSSCHPDVIHQLYHSHHSVSALSSRKKCVEDKQLIYEGEQRRRSYRFCYLSKREAINTRWRRKTAVRSEA